jgi:outer membrane murein-binding lipoprotein Lpp
MQYALVLAVALLAGCDEPSREDLAADPVRLKALHAQCATDWRSVGEGACRAADEACRRRFFSGQSGSGEYITLKELPPTPPTFDSPVDDEAEAGRHTPAAFVTETTP